MGTYVATYEKLYTLLAEIEVCLNSRPLCTLSNNPFNQTYLSPGYFYLVNHSPNYLPLTLVVVRRVCLDSWRSYGAFSRQV
jgi:hypothetical protein